MADKLNYNSSYHISDRPDLYQPAVSNTFVLVIGMSNLSTLGLPDVNLDKNLLLPGRDSLKEDFDDNDYLKLGTNASDIIRISVISGKVPHFSLDPIEIRRGNSRVKFAGSPSFENEDLTLQDYVGARTKDILMAWQAKAYDVVNDIVHTSDNYKINCTLNEYSPDMQTLVRSWDMIGCWIGGISEDNFNVQERKERQITATLHYDRAIPNYSNTNQIVVTQ